MIFILYSEINENSIKNNLGQAEYSYFYVLKGYKTALEKIGKVIVIDTPEEADNIYKRNKGACVFLSFSPPHRTATGLKCPTLSVFAWEFSTVPTQTWDENPNNDWRNVFQQHGSALCLSKYSAQAVKDAMGEDFPVAAIPVPVWNDYSETRNYLAKKPASNTSRLEIEGQVIDSRNFSLAVSTKMTSEAWDGSEIILPFTFINPTVALLNGFYAAESWGTWSRTNSPWITLPYKVDGDIEVTIEALAYENNVGREIQVSIGNSVQSCKFDGQLKPVTLFFNLTEEADRLTLGGINNIPPANATDSRTLGLGLKSVIINKMASANKAAVTRQEDPLKSELILEGVVYTTVLNPSDGRKNWTDIITAFCYAFKDTADATLVLKMSTGDATNFIASLHMLFTRLTPFKCRVVAIHGYLDDDSYRQLVSASNYYVNASHCEGLCLPLMEFLSCGIPAIAPDNTAMNDYITSDIAFIVKSSHEQNVWPDDPRDLFRALRYRINWESLRDAYLASHAIFKNDAGRYEGMSEKSISSMQGFCSVESVTEKLGAFFEENKESLMLEEKIGLGSKIKSYLNI